MANATLADFKRRTKSLLRTEVDDDDLREYIIDAIDEHLNSGSWFWAETNCDTHLSPLDPNASRFPPTSGV